MKVNSDKSYAKMIKWKVKQMTKLKKVKTTWDTDWQ